MVVGVSVMWRKQRGGSVVLGVSVMWRNERGGSMVLGVSVMWRGMKEGVAWCWVFIPIAKKE